MRPIEERPQRAFDHLRHRVARQRVHERDALRHLVAGELRAARGLDLLDARRRAGREHDRRDDALPEPRIRNPEHRALGDGRVRASTRSTSAG